MTSFVKLSLMLNVLTLALLPMASGQGMELPGPIQSPTTPMVPRPTAAAAKSATTAEPTDSNGCALTPPVAGYSVWFDARDIDGDGDFSDQSDAAAVTTWVPKGLSGESVTQGTAASKPTLDDDCVSTDTFWCVSFDGGDKLSGTTPSNWDFVNNGQDQSLFFLGKKSGGASDQGPWSTGGHTGANNGTLLYFASNTRAWGQGDVGSNFAVALNAGPSAGASEVSQTIWSFTVNFDNDGKGYLNGTQTATDTSFTSAQADGGSTEALTLGAYGGSFYFTGNLQQALQYPSALGTTDREAVEEWLSCLGGL